MSETTAPLANPARHITDNDTNGQSAFSSVLPSDLPVTKDMSGALFRMAYLGGLAPDTLTDQADLKNYQKSLANPPALVPSGGQPIVWYVDTPPGRESPLHRTVSMDFVVLLEGEIELILESGETRVIRPGDCVIQRSTMHKWRNLSETKWSRMLCVMMECKPVEVGGRVLEMEFR